MAAYLICYDIANPKRLAKVHRCTVKQAAFIQYSVYYFEGSKAELQTVLAELENIINKKQDDIRVYGITSLNNAITLGRTWVPEDVYLL